MKHSEPKLKLAALAAMMLLCCSTLFINGKAQAQPPCGPGDSHCSIVENVPGSCKMEIQYCMNCTTGKITVLSALPYDCPGAPSYYDLKTAMHMFVHDAAAYENCCPGFLPPCPGTTNVTLIVHECWEYQNNGPSTPEWCYYPCPGVQGDCTITYTICKDQYTGVVTVKLISETSNYVECPTAPLPPINWTPYECYNINPCDWLP